MQESLIETAVSNLVNGGVIAYPTEHCFGLGCDPQNRDAINHLLKIKKRTANQGLILVASSIKQIEDYVYLESSPMLDEIKLSWPGHVTWLLNSKAETPNLISGKHATIAVRQTNHPLLKQLCESFGGAIVSTSANRHANPALMSAVQVQKEFSLDVDYILDASIGEERKPSTIRDGKSGVVIR